MYLELEVDSEEELENEIAEQARDMEAAGGLGRWLEQENGVDAVSYTHLTLPTKA